MKTTLTVEVEFDQSMTDPEGLATALDLLLETALSTPGILDDYGRVEVSEFLPPQEVEIDIGPLDARICKMHDDGAAHRKGFKLNEVSLDTACMHLIHEMSELCAAKTHREKLDEAGDMLAIYLHLIYMFGLPLSDVIEAADKKLTLRFPAEKERWAREGLAPPPTFQVKREGKMVSFRCPNCGQINHHNPGDGHRASHCECWRPYGYFIKE